jgi:hypothetical protein
MIEIFRTNVIDPKQAKFLKDQIMNRFDHYEASFDLEDCDRILRIKTSDGHIIPDLIIRLFDEFGFMAQLLPENYPMPILQSLIHKIPVNNCW